VKILFLDQFSELGGAQRALIDTVDAVSERGWKSHAAIPSAGPLVEQLRSRGLDVTSIPCGPYRSQRKSAADFVRLAFDLREQTRVIRNLAAHPGFDLIYVNGPRLLPAAALACGRGTPVLFHAHSHVSQTIAAKFTGWSLARANATIIACSNSVLEPLRRYANNRSYVIPNGAPDLGFHERQFSREKSWRIGMIARISPEKGQLEFLQAAALLTLEFSTARFLICGAPLFAETNYYQRVRKLAEGLPVEFLGWRENVAPVFAGLDLLVAPSTEEGMGRVLAEAFSAGVPVVAFPTGGIPELVIDQETGFLTRDLSAKSLAARIREIIVMDPQALRTVAANARKKWELCYTVAGYQQRITAVMEKLVAASQADHEKAALPQRR